MANIFPDDIIATARTAAEAHRDFTQGSASQTVTVTGGTIPTLAGAVEAIENRTSIIRKFKIYQRSGTVPALPTGGTFVDPTFEPPTDWLTVIEAGVQALWESEVTILANNEILYTLPLETPIFAATLGDGDVTTQTIADAAVTEVKIDDAAVTSTKIAPAAVTGTKIADATITRDKFDTTLRDDIARIGSSTGGQSAQQVNDAIAAAIAALPAQNNVEDVRVIYFTKVPPKPGIPNITFTAGTGPGAGYVISDPLWTIDDFRDPVGREKVYRLIFTRHTNGDIVPSVVSRNSAKLTVEELTNAINAQIVARVKGFARTGQAGVAKTDLTTALQTEITNAANTGGGVESVKEYAELTGRDIETRDLSEPLRGDIESMQSFQGRNLSKRDALGWDSDSTYGGYDGEAASTDAEPGGGSVTGGETRPGSATQPPGYTGSLTFETPSAGAHSGERSDFWIFMDADTGSSWANNIIFSAQADGARQPLNLLVGVGGNLIVRRINPQNGATHPFPHNVQVGNGTSNPYSYRTLPGSQSGRPPTAAGTYFVGNANVQAGEAIDLDMQVTDLGNRPGITNVRYTFTGTERNEIRGTGEFLENLPNPDYVEGGTAPATVVVKTLVYVGAQFFVNRPSNAPAGLAVSRSDFGSETAEQRASDEVVVNIRVWPTRASGAVQIDILPALLGTYNRNDWSRRVKFWLSRPTNEAAPDNRATIDHNTGYSLTGLTKVVARITRSGTGDTLDIRADSAHNGTGVRDGIQIAPATPTGYYTRWLLNAGSNIVRTLSFAHRSAGDDAAIEIGGLIARFRGATPSNLSPTGTRRVFQFPTNELEFWENGVVKDITQLVDGRIDDHPSANVRTVTSLSLAGTLFRLQDNFPSVLQITKDASGTIEVNDILQILGENYTVESVQSVNYGSGGGDTVRPNYILPVDDQNSFYRVVVETAGESPRVVTFSADHEIGTRGTPVFKLVSGQDIGDVIADVARIDTALSNLSSSSGGLTQLQVDERVRAGVKDFAEFGNAQQVVAGDIADASITTPKLVDLAVTEDKIGFAAVTTEKIAEGAVTRLSIASRTITGAKIGVGAVLTDNLMPSAVTADKIAARSVTANKIAQGVIAPNKLATASNPTGTAGQIPVINSGGDAFIFQDLPTGGGGSTPTPIGLGIAVGDVRPQTGLTGEIRGLAVSNGQTIVVSDINNTGLVSQFASYTPAGVATLIGAPISVSNPLTLATVDGVTYTNSTTGGVTTLETVNTATSARVIVGESTTINYAAMTDLLGELVAVDIGGTNIYVIDRVTAQPTLLLAGTQVFRDICGVGGLLLAIGSGGGTTIVAIIDFENSSKRIIATLRTADLGNSGTYETLAVDHEGTLLLLGPNVRELTITGAASTADAEDLARTVLAVVGDGNGGLTQADVDVRVAALTEAWALIANSTTSVPLLKIREFAQDAIYNFGTGAANVSLLGLGDFNSRTPDPGWQPYNAVGGNYGLPLMATDGIRLTILKADGRYFQWAYPERLIPGETTFRLYFRTFHDSVPTDFVNVGGGGSGETNETEVIRIANTRIKPFAQVDNAARIVTGDIAEGTIRGAQIHAETIQGAHLEPQTITATEIEGGASVSAGQVLRVADNGTALEFSTPAEVTPMLPTVTTATRTVVSDWIEQTVIANAPNGGTRASFTVPTNWYSAQIIVLNLRRNTGGTPPGRYAELTLERVGLEAVPRGQPLNDDSGDGLGATLDTTGTLPTITMFRADEVFKVYYKTSSSETYVTGITFTPPSGT